MIYELDQKNYYIIKDLIKNTEHELSIEAVIVGNSLGEIYVDNCQTPRSALIMTPECNVAAGIANNCTFNESVKKKLDFYDQITCDDDEWEKNIHKIHNNISIRRYKRRYYKFNKLKYKDYANNLNKEYTIEYVDVEKLNKINYKNSDKIREWIKPAFSKLDNFKHDCLGAYIRAGNKIVSWCLVDCKVDNRIEIGVTTDKEFRKKGLGSIVTAATVSSCLQKGVKDIGWHCVDTNVGSYKIAEKVGFIKIEEYNSFTPYPPIENESDLNSEQWTEWAQYYEKANKVQPRFYRDSAECWAKANKAEETINSLKKLIDTGWKCNVENLFQHETFLRFKGNTKWNTFIDYLRDICE